MRLLILTALALALAAPAFTAELAPAPYYNVNPYDDLVVGPGLRLSGWQHTLALGAGYSVARHDARGFVRYRHERGLGGRLGYDLHLFHQVDPIAALVPLNQTGFYEGHTGGTASLFYRLGFNEVATLSLTADKVWALPGEGTLRATTGDRIYATSLNYRFDTRDDALDPRAGRRAAVSVTQAMRVFGGSRAYLSSKATLTRYEPFGAAGTRAWRLHAAATAGRLPEQRQIWLPGEGVRGYDFVSNGGDLAGIANLEYRLPLLRDRNLPLGRLGTLARLEIAAFGDLGMVRNPEHLWLCRTGLGVGLRAPVVLYPGVPLMLRLDVAKGLTDGGKLKSYLLLGAPELF